MSQQDIRIMDKGAIGWMTRYASKNYWRIAAHMDFEDLCQEGIECYYRVVRRYVDGHYNGGKGTVTDRPHIMRMFQLRFRSRIEDLAKSRSQQVDFAVGDLFESTIQVPDLNATAISELSARLAKAPLPVKNVLQLFLTPEGLAELQKPYEIREGKRETFNQRLCRLTGLDPKVTNLPKLVQSYFST